MEEENKKNEYLNYINEHITNVKKAYKFYGKELCKRLNIDYDLLGKLVEDHDKSKYTPEEFDGYRMFFYPTEEEENDPDINGYRKAKFDAAWLYHLRNNAHHPEFWIHGSDDGFTVTCSVMDNIHIAEMLLDWAAMGVVKKDTAYEYWSQNIDAKPFNRKTVEVIDSVIDIFKEKIPL